MKNKGIVDNINKLVNASGYVIGISALVLTMFSVFGLPAFIKDNLGSVFLGIASFLLILLSSSVSIITSNLRSINKRLDSIDATERSISLLRNELDLMPKDALAISNWIGKHHIKHVENILKHKKFEVLGGYLFRNFYIETFSSIRSPCDMIASALPSREYFWKHKEVINSFKKFIGESENSLKRVFILDSENDLEKEEVIEIFNEQHLVNVEVYYIFKKQRPDWKLMLADSRHKISWEIRVTDKGDIESTHVNWNQQTVHERYEFLNGLLNDYRTQRYLPAEQS